MWGKNCETGSKRRQNLNYSWRLDAVLSEFNKRSGQKISQDREALNNTVRQPDPIDISRSLSDNSRLHLLLKCTWKSHKDILSHKVIPDKLERTEIIQSILSDHNAIKPEIKSKKISGMPLNIWKVKTVVKEEVLQESRKHFELIENKSKTYQNVPNAGNIVRGGNLLH